MSLGVGSSRKENESLEIFGGSNIKRKERIKNISYYVIASAIISISILTVYTPRWSFPCEMARLKAYVGAISTVILALPFL